MGREVDVWWLLWVWIAFAQQPLSANERLDEAWRRIETGDFAGARVLTAEIDDSPASSHGEEALYVTAVSFQLEGSTDRAVDTFRTLLERWPMGVRADDARFRTALTLGPSDPAAALDALNELKPWNKLPEDGARRVGWSRAAWSLDLDRWTRGRKLIAKEERIGAPYLDEFEVRARASFLAAQLRRADEAHFDVATNRIKARLKVRRASLDAADVALDRLVELGALQPVFRGLIDLADSYEDLVHDVQNARIPRRLDDAQVAHYRKTLAPLELDLKHRALTYYEHARTLSVRFEASPDTLTAMQEGIERLQRDIEDEP